MLLQSYLVQVRLSAVILTKMEQSIRNSNGFARQLQDRIIREKHELPEFNYNTLFSSVVSSQESIDSDTAELKSFLRNKINVIQMMIDDCYVKEGNAMHEYVSELNDVFETVTNIAKSDLLQFDKAKDIIAQNLVGIQNF